MTQKEILAIIGQKQPDYDKKTAQAWLKKHPIFVKELDAEIVANQYLNELTEEVRIASLESKKGILLGTIDRKFSKSSKIVKVFADILTEDGLERIQWWGSIPKENKSMQTLPILKTCFFMGSMTDAWVSPSGDEYTNFDVEAIKPTRKKAIAPDDFLISSAEIIEPSTDVLDLPEGKYMMAVIGKISTVRSYQEKSWDDNEGAFVFGAEHPLFMSGNLCLTFGIRVNEDIYVKAHFPEQKLGWPTWSISNDLTTINGIKQVLANMPVNATNERKMATQLQNQLNTTTSIFKGFSATVIGEARITRSESVDEIRTFIEMFPSFIAISATVHKTSQATLVELEEEIEEPEELTDPEEAETFVVPIGLTEEKLIYEAVSDLGPQGEALAKAKVKELIHQYERFGMEINIENIIKTAAKELNVDITGYEKAQAQLIEERAQVALTKKEPAAKKKDKPTATSKKKKTARKKKESKWIEQFKYINEMLASVKEADEVVNTSLLPLPVWNILLDNGYCFEPREGVYQFVNMALQLDSKIMQDLTKFFNKNPDIQLRPPAIEDIDKAVREKLAALKEVVPAASPEHLMPMLASDNIDCPIELVTQIWESL